MARNDTKRFRTQPADRAQLRADAASWRALTHLMVASTLVVAVVVSALALVEAAFPARRRSWRGTLQIPRDIRAGTRVRQRTSPSSDSNAD